MTIRARSTEGNAGETLNPERVLPTQAGRDTQRHADTRRDTQTQQEWLLLIEETETKAG